MRKPRTPWPRPVRRQAVDAARADRGGTSAAPPSPPGDGGFEADHADGVPAVNRRRVWSLVAVATAGLALPGMRLSGVIDWPWVLVLSPFTVTGAVLAVVIAGFYVRGQLTALQPGAGATPAPDRLDAPAAAGDADAHILAEHPEILAALCHGFRMKRLLPSVLGQPVTDPWGVYRAALTVSASGIDSLQMLARLHTTRFAGAGRKTGRRPSDAQAMRAAIDAFHRCASRVEAGRGHPDCPFEHVTVIFGAPSPNRDAHLKSVAPKVRALLERQYPQLKTARLADGSAVTFGDWRKKASEYQAELARLRKDHERQERAVHELRAQLAAERARVDALGDAAEGQRRQAYDAARSEQQQVVADLRAALDRADKERTRDAQRHATSIARLSAAAETLTAERDALELTLLQGGGDDEAAPDADLSGVRVLLVGGDARQVPPLRERLESLGAQLVHDDSVAAAEHVGQVDVVVFWIRYLSHPTYFGVRQRVRAARVPHGYWMRTSSASLISLVTRTLAAGRAPTSDAESTRHEAPSTTN